jgi:hypothetical protein
MRLGDAVEGTNNNCKTRVLKNEPGPPSCVIGGTVRRRGGAALRELICWL